MNDQQTTDAGQAQQYLTFALGDEMFAIDIRGIKEIIEYGGLTTVPMMPAFIRGVINLRGAVVPVVDLAVKLGMAPATLTRWSCIVVVEVKLGGERVVLGLLSDAIGQVIELEPEAVAAPSSLFGSSTPGPSNERHG